MTDIVAPDSPRWHDKTLDGRPFTCEHCGAVGRAYEANAVCSECENITELPIEVMPEWGPRVDDEAETG